MLQINHEFSLSVQFLREFELTDPNIILYKTIHQSVTLLKSNAILTL